jgi:hypothetical protein
MAPSAASNAQPERDALPNWMGHGGAAGLQKRE